MPFRNPLLLLVCLAMPLPFLSAEVPQATLGIATQKPASGPSVEVEGGFMVPYEVQIPGTDLTIQMIPVPGGSFQMGSPDDEPGRGDDESPRVQVVADPMWVAKTEITWAQYKEFMKLYAIFKQFQADGKRQVDDSNLVDAITAPTELYDPSFTFEYGEEPEQPAVTMTLYSAQQFSKWLSKVTGQQYRLPTEAEWEYAARAGTTTAYSWGDETDPLEDHAWYFDNASEGPQPVGTKQPNAFGLHDMHGNVAEFTVNQHTDGYADFDTGKPIKAIDAVKWPETSSGIVVRGGSWEMDPEQLRSAARLVTSDEDWKEEDPNFPRSPWWFTSDPSRGVGFRIFRSYQPLDPDTITKFWEPTSQEVKDDVESRLSSGSGGLGLVDMSLPEAIKGMRQ
jgi:formylglycine-generating enzyme required for sulfatase activity